MAKSDYDIGACQAVVATSLDDSPGLLVQTGDTLVYGLHILNGAGAVTWVQLLDAAALNDVTLGTTVPKASFPIAASGVLDIQLHKPLYFSKGLCVFSTTTATGSTGATTNGTFIYS